MTRLTSAWTRHGPTGFLRLALKNAAHYAIRLFSGRLFVQAKQSASDFDHSYGIETERIHEIGSLDVAMLRNARHAVRYQPSPAPQVEDAIRSLEIDYAKYTFVDFGSGKGRVLVIAGTWPFRSVIGVEFSRQLCESARKNLATIDGATFAASRIECVNSDVTTFPIPDDPLVCYFYNPFGRAIMGQVIDQLVESLRQVPRDVYVIYLHPEQRALFERSGLWEVVSEKNSLLILKAAR